MSNEEANLEKIDKKKIYFSKKTGSLLFTLLRMSSGCVPVQQMLNVEKMHVHWKPLWFIVLRLDINDKLSAQNVSTTLCCIDDNLCHETKYWGYHNCDQLF